MGGAALQVWLLKENLEKATEISATLNELGEVTSFARFEEMISTYNKENESPDLIVTEYNLRTGNFIESIAKWNQAHFFEKVPTIMISAIECPETIRALFQSGIREYFTLPVSTTELLIKTEQILQNLSSQPVYSGQYIRYGKKLISGLTRKEIQIFQFLQSKKCNSATREELQSYCWPEQSMTGQTLNVHIHNMRRKLFNFGLSIRGQRNGIWKLEEVELARLQTRQRVN